MPEKLEKSPEGLPRSAHLEETYKTPDPRPHYMEMDGLRGIGVLGVALAHTASVWWSNTKITLIIPLFEVDLLDSFLYFTGFFGFCMFFLLSGYLLTWTEEARRRRGTYSALNYAKRRVLRIVPAYYTAIVVVIVLAPLGWPQVDPSFGSVAINLTFLQSFFPTYPTGLPLAWWSLTPEAVFYATLPLLVLKLRNLWQRVTIFGVLLLASVAAHLWAGHGTFQWMGWNSIAILYLFLAGMLLRMMVEQRAEAGREPGHQQLFLASTLSVISIALFLVLVLVVFPYLGMDPKHVRLGLTFMIVEATAILAFISTLLGSLALNPVLRWRPLVFFGKISYSMFLLHSTVIVGIMYYIRPTLRHWLPHQGELTVWATFFAFALAVLAVSGVLGYLSYRYIESPFMRIKPK